MMDREDRKDRGGQRHGVYVSRINGKTLDNSVQTFTPRRFTEAEC